MNIDLNPVTVKPTENGLNQRLLNLHFSKRLVDLDLTRSFLHRTTRVNYLSVLMLVCLVLTSITLMRNFLVKSSNMLDMLIVVF